MILHPWRLRSMRLKPVHVALAAAVLLLGLAGIVLVAVVRAARQMPAFYVAALAQPAPAQKAAGQRFEQQALTLHNGLREAGLQSVRFTEDEINGWLAAELPAKFPQALPRGIADPRVAIQARTIQFAMRWQEGSVQSIVHLSAEIFLSSEPNEVGVRLKRAQLGALPLPLAQVRASLQELAGHSQVRLRWSEIDGDPVVLFKLFLNPSDEDERGVIVEAIDLGDREIVISWRG